MSVAVAAGGRWTAAGRWRRRMEGDEPPADRFRCSCSAVPQLRMLLILRCCCLTSVGVEVDEQQRWSGVATISGRLVGRRRGGCAALAQTDSSGSGSGQPDSSRPVSCE
jgi:hypothetical protein